ncbi:MULTISPECIES: hypothetical protein [Nocardia]|nr:MULTISPECIES: hypothetical protein [Nocardia]
MRKRLAALLIRLAHWIHRPTVTESWTLSAAEWDRLLKTAPRES